VLNSGDLDEYYSFFWDVVPRGIRATPTGVSDAHGRTGASLGCSSTFIQMGSADPQDYEPDDLRQAIRAGRTVVTRGPFIRLTGATPGDTVTEPTTITAEALSPSWIVVNRIELVRDGVIVETVDGTTATFDLDPDVDAVYAVIAEGDQSMGPIYGKTPWAMTSPIYVDLGGDGWTPPLPPLEVAP
jgi:hypothetical protein